MIGGPEVEYRNKFRKDDKISTLLSAVGPFYGETIVNNMEKLKTAEGKEITCDAIMEKLRKMHRATCSVKGIVVGPTETDLADPRCFAKDKTRHYCRAKAKRKQV